MKEADSYNSPEKNHISGKECRYCRVFQKQGPQLCKYCVVYGHRLKYILRSTMDQNSSSVGEYLPVLDYSAQEIIKLYRTAGSDWKQIEDILYAIIKEDIRIISKQEENNPIIRKKF